MGFQRDNILNADEKRASARKCLALLAGFEEAMRDKDKRFYSEQSCRSVALNYNPSEPQLQWLRDLVDRYCH
jgi:hypothetical protein